MLGGLSQLGKGFGFFHSQIGQNLAIEIDARFLQAMNQVAIGNSIQLRGGADSYNPQTRLRTRRSRIEYFSAF